MDRRSGRWVLPLCYFAVVGVVAGVLAVVGALLERSPLVPAAATRAYRRGLLACLRGLAAPVDRWAEPAGSPSHN